MFHQFTECAAGSAGEFVATDIGGMAAEFVVCAVWFEGSHGFDATDIDPPGRWARVVSGNPEEVVPLKAPNLSDSSKGPVPFSNTEMFSP